MAKSTNHGAPRNSVLRKHAIVGSHYGFSAARVDQLGAAEYTLVTIAADVSGSVSSFKSDIERCIREVVEACRRSPRVDNLMLRLVAFDDKLHELHGFKPLSECHPNDYKSCLTIGGYTSLYDAALNGVSAIASYGTTLHDADFDVNGILFVITDGCDNGSKHSAKDLKHAVRGALGSEELESLVTVLVGVNVGQSNVSKELQRICKEAAIDQYIEIAKATAAKLAKLASFVSRSIAAQSKALGSGQASHSLTF
jgi:hypothetical protein